MSGRVICVVGTPAAGKTHLAKKLAKHYNAELVLEVPYPDFLPKEIQNNLSTQTNFFENQMWFRNHQIKSHKEALRIAKEEKKNVIIDMPFYYNQLYNNYVLDNEFQKQILKEIGEHDLEHIKHPCCTIYLDTNQDSMKKFLEQRRGNWEWENDSWREFILGIIPAASEFMKSVEDQIPNLITIKRDEYDFKIEQDLNKLINQIDNKLLN